MSRSWWIGATDRRAFKARWAREVPRLIREGSADHRFGVAPVAFRSSAEKDVQEVICHTEFWPADEPEDETE